AAGAEHRSTAAAVTAAAARPPGPAPYTPPGATGSVPGPRTPPPGPPGDGPRRRPRPRRNRRGLVLFVGVLALVVLVAVAGWWLGMGRFTSTPGVLNLPEARAAAKVRDAGLEWKVSSRAFSETVTAGSVISTDPGGGHRIVQGGTVEAVVSKGPERYTVPRLHGKTLEKATQLLQDSNLTLGDVTQVFNETVPEGLVVRASPGFGVEQPPGAAVSVTVSKGPKPIRIPDFTGKDAERAQSVLGEKGFKVDVSDENSDTVPEGRVIAQTPSSGKGFRDDVIRLVVSKGPVMVEVPRLATQSVEDATKTLQDLGFQVKVVKTDLYIGWDRVVRQSPGGGDSAPKGSTVTLHIV
ncbi:Stk1 family PASTA domain-containing Ser/Thr kinase, partial [Nocardioides marmoribigeumensis]